MIYTNRLELIHRRAERVNLPFTELCRRAGAEYKLIHKWTKGVRGRPISPNTRTVERELSLLEAFLRAEENRLYLYLHEMFAERPTEVAA